MKKLEFERCLVVASSLGLAQAALNDAGAYASERICFNKPIAHQTQIQLHLCEMENIIQNVRTRLYQVVTMIDNGESTRLESALLKGYACRELTRKSALAASGQTSAVTKWAAAPLKSWTTSLVVSWLRSTRQSNSPLHLHSFRKATPFSGSLFCTYAPFT